jgi:hypothetical protein
MSLSNKLKPPLGILSMLKVGTVGVGALGAAWLATAFLLPLDSEVKLVLSGVCGDASETSGDPMFLRLIDDLFFLMPGRDLARLDATPVGGEVGANADSPVAFCAAAAVAGETVMPESPGLPARSGEVPVLENGGKYGLRLFESADESGGLNTELGKVSAAPVEFDDFGVTAGMSFLV